MVPPLHIIIHAYSKPVARKLIPWWFFDSFQYHTDTGMQFEFASNVESTAKACIYLELLKSSQNSMLLLESIYVAKPDIDNL